ncbi:hypothetical protein [Enterobacter soli]|uniref:hypothetical protein n=1 Tax=Enterobacter soli TaxID=885040 RepID=UPI003ED9AF45
MIKGNFCKIAYFPVLMIYAGLPLVRDVIPYHSGYNSEDLFALAGMYVLGTLIVFPLLYLLHKSDKFGYGNSIIPRVFVTLLLQLVCLCLFWNESAFLYLSMSAIMGVSAVIFGYGKKGLNLLRDKDTGNLYEIRGTKAYRLNDLDAAKYQSVSMGKGIQFAEFSSGEITGFDASSSVQSVSNTFSHSDLIVNPSSGIPMIGGISGLDIHGNSWGTNFNEPSNTYDPNRGY